MNRFPTYLAAGICLRSCLPLVRNADHVGRGALWCNARFAAALVAGHQPCTI